MGARGTTMLQSTNMFEAIIDTSNSAFFNTNPAILETTESSKAEQPYFGWTATKTD
jgi:hypothetical protein